MNSGSSGGKEFLVASARSPSPRLSINEFTMAATFREDDFSGGRVIVPGTYLPRPSVDPSPKERNWLIAAEKNVEGVDFMQIYPCSPVGLQCNHHAEVLY